MNGRTQGVVRGLLLLLGLGVLGFGGYGFLTEPYLDGQRLAVLVWGGAGIVLHDGFWMPVVLALGALLVRVVPERVRGVVVVGLITVAALTAVGLPVVLRAGDDHGNPTLLPLPYLRNWLLLLAGVLVAVGVACAVLLLRRKRGQPKRGSASAIRGADSSESGV